MRAHVCAWRLVTGHPSPPSFSCCVQSAAKELLDLMFALTNYRSSTSNQTLAGVATVFLPLTWLAGIYGMWGGRGWGACGAGK